MKTALWLAWIVLVVGAMKDCTVASRLDRHIKQAEGAPCNPWEVP